MLFVRYRLDVDFPMDWALVAIGMSVVLNLGLFLYAALARIGAEWQAAALLAYDVIQLAALLALTGGLQNPFVFFSLHQLRCLQRCCGRR